MHILHNHGAIGRLRPLHHVIEGALGHELDVLVDRQFEILPRLRLAFGRPKTVVVRIHCRVLAPRNAVQLRLELLLQATQAVVVNAHIAQYLRGDFVVRIETLKLLLKVDALHGQTLHLQCNIRRNPPCDPGKAIAFVETIENLLLSGLRIVGINVNDGRECVRGGRLVVDLNRHGKDRVHLHRHGQLVQIAVVQNAAPRRDFKRALLLLLRALNEFLMANNLEPEKTACDRAGPKKKEQADQPEARPLERRNAGKIRCVAIESKICLHGGFDP